jgi:hypothetical protein
LNNGHLSLRKETGSSKQNPVVPQQQTITNETMIDAEFSIACSQIRGMQDSIFLR